MLDNTYDIPGMKFYLAFSKTNGKIDKANISSKYFKDDFVKIDFENVDGLRIDTIQQGIYLNRLYVIGISCLDGYKHDGEKNFELSLCMLMWPIDSTYVNGSKTIEEVCEDIIKDKWSSSDADERQAARCFLQRYRYGTKEKTDAKLLELKK